jgi:hypothetical protein
MFAVVQEFISYTPKKIKFLVAGVFALIFFYLVSGYIYTAYIYSTQHIASSEPAVFDRVRAFKEYIRYQYRSFKYDGTKSSAPPLMRHKAKVLGIDKDGNIHVDVYTLKGKVTAWGRIADVDIAAPLQAMLFIKAEIKSETLIVDTYTHEGVKHFVLWLSDGTPLNESLIMNKLATPSGTPPTNIVNTLFMTHYKNIAFNSGQK